jgi:phage replication-related protein YjqB (UPF0714/DUF867 family)
MDGVGGDLPPSGSDPGPPYLPDYFRCFDAHHCHHRALSSSSRCLPGRDYTVTITQRRSPVVILSIHGGLIEPFSTEVSNVAAERFGWIHYDFSAHGTPACLGGRSDRDQLHITASHFDDPAAVWLVAAPGARAVAIHGNRYLAIPGQICVGGGNQAERTAFLTAVDNAPVTWTDYPLLPMTTLQSVVCSSVSGDDPRNLVNRVASGRGGLQLELSLQLLADLNNPDPRYDTLRAVFYGALGAAMAY